MEEGSGESVSGGGEVEFGECVDFGCCGLAFCSHFWCLVSWTASSTLSSSFKRLMSSVNSSFRDRSSGSSGEMERPSLTWSSCS